MESAASQWGRRLCTHALNASTICVAYRAMHALAHTLVQPFGVVVTSHIVTHRCNYAVIRCSNTTSPWFSWC